MKSKKNKTKKYIAVFVVKEQEVHTILSKKKFKPTNTTVRFRKHTYIMDVEIPTYSHGLYLYYFIDLRKGQQILSDDIEIEEEQDLDVDSEEYTNQLLLKAREIDPEITDMLISRKIISQLTTNLSDTAMKINIMTLLIGGVIGAMVGYTIARM